MAETNDRVDFPEIEGGVGVHLAFTWNDRKALRSRIGPEWFSMAPAKMDQFDIEAMEIFLDVGGKNAKGQPRPIRLDELDKGGITMSKVATRILDALFLSAYGRGFMDHNQYVIERLEEARKAGENPQIGPAGTILTSLNAPPTGSDSNQESSTSSPPAEPGSSSKSEAAGS
jgi:hypothetical protein